MRIKTFYAKSMSEAFREIKIHLGSDAILLSTKEIPSRSGEWGRSSGFEVVAACDDEENIDVYSGPSARSPRESASTPETMEIPVIEPELETYSPAKLARRARESEYGICNSEAVSLHFPKPLHENKTKEDFTIKGKVASDVRRYLVESGIDSSLAKRLLSLTWTELTAGQRRSRAALKRSISQTALKMLPARQEPNGMPVKKVMVFVGPTGVGKTTSIAKLAARLALQNKKKVLLVTTDGYRIGAIDQLKTYAGLMGIPFCFADQVHSLAQIIEENRNRDYIMIDTAGRSPRELKSMKPLAEFIRTSSNMEKHLVLSATTNSRDLRAALDAFEICGPDHLLFTKLDETSTPGPILNEIIRTQKSLSYFCDGQRVPEDLHTATSEQIIERVFNRNEIAFKD